ncbi:hypothetical protein TFLX_03829 [Thermoflexales bacterium]|nr:hypothetical protein TFLX_03829 [Thermoflexales bacterium]
MDKQLTTAQLLEVMHTARSNWEALLREAGEARLTEPGVEGDWSLKDIIAHITYFETWATNCLMAIRRGEPLPLPEYKGLSIDEENALIYERQRSLPLADVLRDSQISFQRSIESVQGLHDDDLYDVKFTRATGVAWSVHDLLDGDTYEHYQEHSVSVRAWLDRVAAH